MIIKHFGFDHPPTGIIQILQILPWITEPTIYIVDPLNQPQIPYPEIQAAAKHDLFVIINTHEGASHRWFDRLIPKLNQECGVPLKQIVLHSSCLSDPDSPIQHIGSIVDYASDIRSKFCDWNKPLVHPSQYHFVCMNRSHRWQRLELVSQLLDRGLDKKAAISFIDTSRVSPAHRHYQILPLILDDQSPAWEECMYGIFNYMIYSAVNVITESCYEPDPNNKSLTNHFLPCLTEKTFKSILLGQLPIWLAPMGTVKCVRELGFDVFDDVIDHSYDLEVDPIRRIDLVVKEVSRVSALTLQELDQMRSARIDRFKSNFDRLDYLAFNHLAELPIWQKRLARWLVDQ